MKITTQKMLTREERWQLERVVSLRHIVGPYEVGVSTAVEHLLYDYDTLSRQLEKDKKRSQALEQGISELRAVFYRLVQAVKE